MVARKLGVGKAEKSGKKVCLPKTYFWTNPDVLPAGFQAAPFWVVDGLDRI
jgi:hypothetical protein